MGSSVDIRVGIRLKKLLRLIKDLMKKLRGDRCQCTACGEYFNRTSVFDKHRIGDYGMRRCRTPDVMIAIGMFLGNDGFWRGSRFNGTIPRERMRTEPAIS